MMKKLYFRYGAMTAGKTMNLLAVAKNYELQGKRVRIFKPLLGPIPEIIPDMYIQSRTGIKRPVEALYPHFPTLLTRIEDKVSCILVDEAHFLSPMLVESLRNYTLTHDIPVICYGLRTDYLGNLFLGSKRLLELADTIEEIKTTCWYCERKATMNPRVRGGKEQVEVEPMGEQNYVPTCYKCFQWSIGQ